MFEHQDPRRLRVIALVLLIALTLNVLAWIGASLGPGVQASWRLVSLLGFFVLGLAIGRWWALLVTCAFGVLHAIPVYLGLLPGYLSTWGELLWWAFALALLVALTGLGVTVRGAGRGLRRRLGASDADRS